MDTELLRKLSAAGIVDISDPAAAFEALAAHSGSAATLFDRIAIEAAALGVDTLTEADKRRVATHFYGLRWEGFEMIGERRFEPIEVVPYSSEWPHVFERWRLLLAHALGHVALAIDHVGSTAVPGLASKPIVDIQVAVADLTQEQLYVPPMESLNVDLRSRDSAHRYLRPHRDFPREVHVHVCDDGGDWATEHLLFRDYLRSHDDVRDEYGALKQRLADEFRDDRVAYTEMKSDFIAHHMELARRWEV